MEKRIDILDAKIGLLQEEIRNLKNKKNERDTIIIELFKMLENGMKSRFKLISLISQTSRASAKFPTDKIVLYTWGRI